MNRTCPECGKEFKITEDDLKLLEKISPVFGGKKYSISEPTLCSDCRHQHRLTFRNDRNLYRRKCDSSGKEMISMYRPDSEMTVYQKDIWWGDSWDGTDFGRDFDFSRPFFQQFAELMRAVPHPSLNVLQNKNSEYVNYTGWNKNCYLCFAGNSLEDSLYCYNVENSRNCLDCLDLLESENCYESIQCNGSYGLLFSLHCKNCTDSAFLEDCSGCSNCFLCWNLRNKKYCILNQEYSKEEYEKKLQKFSFSTFSGLQKLQALFQKERQKYPKKNLHNVQTENCNGEYVVQSKNCHDCYVMHKDCEDTVRILFGFPGLKDSRDNSFAGENSSFLYESVCAGDRCDHCAFGNTVINGCQEVYYSDFTINCQYCFGCSGLRNRKYCILNKQYSKKEYEELVPRIIEHMQKNPLNPPLPQTGAPLGSGGRHEWGEFFPVEISPFAYNETVAQEYFPLTEDEVLKKGWKWKEAEEPDFSEVTKRIPAEKLPDSISDIPDDILNWALVCAESKRLFKIQKAELDFYRKMNLPIPRLHPDLRHLNRIALRNPRQLWERDCANCQKKIETSYAPERSEIVYCEDCYLKTVY